MYHPGSKGKSQRGKAQPLIHEKWKKWAGKKESKHPNTFKQISQHIYPISRHIYQISQHIYHPLPIRGILFPACLKVGRGKDWEIQVKWLRFPIKSNWFGLERTLKITRILVFRSISSAGRAHPIPTLPVAGKCWEKLEKDPRCRRAPRGEFSPFPFLPKPFPCQDSSCFPTFPAGSSGVNPCDSIPGDNWSAGKMEWKAEWPEMRLSPSSI